MKDRAIGKEVDAFRRRRVQIGRETGDVVLGTVRAQVLQEIG
jgi:hypothetical protein